MWRFGLSRITVGQRSRRWVGYSMALVIATILAVVYSQQRSLRARYDTYLDNEAMVQGELRKKEALEQRLEQSRERVESLANDQLEIESAIRREGNFVRRGEKIYRIEKVSADDLPEKRSLDVTPEQDSVTPE